LYNSRDSNFDYTGNYNISVLEKALINKNFIVIEKTGRLDELIASRSKALYLYTSSDYHISLNQNGNLNLFDSLLSKPILRNNFWYDLKSNQPVSYHAYEIQFNNQNPGKLC
jgi:hypothetical protein